jgi:hypothetical protein
MFEIEYKPYLNVEQFKVWLDSLPDDQVILGASCQSCALAQYIQLHEPGKKIWCNRWATADGALILLPDIFSLFSWFAGYHGITDAKSLKQTLNWLIEVRKGKEE